MHCNNENLILIEMPYKGMYQIRPVEENHQGNFSGEETWEQKHECNV